MADEGIRLEPRAELDRELLAGLVSEGRAEGFRFLDRLVDDWRTGANRFDRPGEILLVATSAGPAPARVIGIGGLNVDPFLEDPTTARLRHLYVRASHRRTGAGRSLVRRLVEHARAASFRRIRLRTGSPEAARFYETLGFVRSEASATATHELCL